MEVSVIVDNRERNTALIEKLAEHGVNIRFATVPAGDYVVSDRACIERKSSSDFESSIMNSRLFEQLSRLKESFAKPMLLIEEGEGFRLGRNVILGAILSVYLDYNIQVIISEGPEDSAEIIEKIARREQSSEKREPRLVGIKKAYSTYQWQLLLLESIPGVGPKLAKALLSRFKSIRKVMNANAEELMKVDKIGKKKAKRIEFILNAEYEEVEKYNK